MASLGKSNINATKAFQDGPNKVVPYKNAESYIKGCGQSYSGAPEGKTPFHARTQDYAPEKITDHTGGRGAKGMSQVGRAPKAHSDHTGSLATPIKGPLFRRDNGGR